MIIYCTKCDFTSKVPSELTMAELKDMWTGAQVRHAIDIERGPCHNDYLRLASDKFIRDNYELTKK